MGKKDKKKKGKGAEKTAAKTEKKVMHKMKKELDAKGEEDIEALLNQFMEQDRKLTQVTETVTAPPSLRCNFTLSAHPLKDELILFGGEYFNGHKTFVYNDLYIYTIKKNEWILVNIPGGPPPRCAHQAVSLSQNGGQLWVFGGEFTSASQSQFYHYKDLWLLHLQNKKWEKIVVPDGPSSRSGHRMVNIKKHLFIFGGFHDNLRDCKYYNDVHAFNTETYAWEKLSITGQAPSPRSGCQIASLADGQILIFGGYSKQKAKKDVESGQAFMDVFLLQKDKNDKSDLKWKWTLKKQIGARPSPRCGCTFAVGPNNRAFVFGGVHDTEDEENLQGTFYNDLFQLDLEDVKWIEVKLTGKRPEGVKKKRRRKLKNEEEDTSAAANTVPEAESNSEVSDDDEEDEEYITDDAKENSKKLATDEIKESVENLTIEEGSLPVAANINKSGDTDDVFKVTIGPSTTSSKEASGEISSTTKRGKASSIHPRMNPGMVIKQGVLYLYGGIFEEGDKQITLDDFYSLDIHHLDEWKTIIESKKVHEWIDSESSDDEDEDEDEEGAVGGEEVEAISSEGSSDEKE